MESLAKELDKEVSDKIWGENHWLKSKFRLILNVHERIELTDRLLDFQKRDKLNNVQVLPLRIYLLLTCFDQLGQRDAWYSFTDFLEAKKFKKQISDYLEDASEKTEIQRIQYLNRKYNELFGVRSSFMRFINEVIDENTRKALLGTIRIETFDAQKLKAQHSDDNEKINYLFKIRNDYTHNSYLSALIEMPIKNEEEWYLRESFSKKNLIHNVKTHSSFLKILKETALLGIANTILKAE